jgi:hypothetical protein
MSYLPRPLGRGYEFQIYPRALALHNNTQCEVKYLWEKTIREK